jgi:hypothetical protein
MQAKLKLSPAYLLIVAFSFFATSCIFLGPSINGNGHVTEQVRAVDPFTEIEVTHGMNVYISQGSPAKVTVVADENLHEYIETEVDGGVLKVSTTERIRRAREKKVLIVVENLDQVSSEAGSNVYSQGIISSGHLTLSAFAGSNLKMELNVKRLNAKSSAGANIFLSGKAMEADLQASSGANLKGEELVIDRCHAKASSGANIFFEVSDELDARSSSGGNIFYWGNPSKTDVSTSSGGNIIKK